MTEEELSVLNRIKEWSVLLKIYYGILFFSFVTVGLVSLLLTLLSLWTNMVLLQSFKSTIKQGRIIEKDSRRNDDESF